MIKLTREEATILAPFNLENDYSKAIAIREISKTVIAYDLLLKLTQAILDGEWEVEEPLYYVRNNKGVALLRKVNGEVETSLPFADFFFDDNKKDFQLTKHEVASYDPRYLEFLEEVE